MMRISRSLEAGVARAFSLVEVVLALGIISFAIVAIFGLFPVGYKNALESRSDTRAAYIAEQIFSDLRSSPYTGALITYPKAGGKLAEFAPLNLDQSGQRILACDANDNLVKEVDSAIYASGLSDSGTDFLVKIVVAPTTFGNLSHVEIEVSSPAAAPLAARSRHGFFTLIGAR